MAHFGRAGPPDIRNTYSLLVLNITFRTGADDLLPLFDRYGHVVDIFIPRDRRTGESRGFAFVRYKHPDEAAKAIERLDGRNVDGRDIVVQYAKYGRNDEAISRGKIIQGEPVRRGETPPRRRHRDRSRSPSRGRDRRDSKRSKRSYSRSYSRSRSRSPTPDRLHHRGSRRRSPSRSISRSRSRSASPAPERGSRSPPPRGRDVSASRSRSPVRSRSHTPRAEKHHEDRDVMPPERVDNGKDAQEVGNMLLLHLMILPVEAGEGLP
eukprot:SM000031S11611  [mRNA]  locus=s31:697584:699902:+ [translate_table: standard]